MLSPKVLSILAVFTLLSFAPVLAVLASSMIAEAFGCRLDEGDAHPCVVLGHDMGDALYTMMVSGWLMLLTWPGMLVTSVLWLVVAVLFGVRRFRRGHA